ncbi:MAG: hypothetical protein GEU99_03025 [Luteitalea sp.]|nr:hypothetical protein [Luteitalea sp.]
MTKTLLLKLVMLVMLVGAVFAVPAYAQVRELCFQGCIQKYQVALSYCALGNASGTYGILCGWAAYNQEILCDAFCW